MVLALGQPFDPGVAEGGAAGAAPAKFHGRAYQPDVALLDMIQQGLTDDRIGRKMGISIRTVRRIMADLMGKLNARSRFQAGVEAARRGWI